MQRKKILKELRAQVRSQLKASAYASKQGRRMFMAMFAIVAGVFALQMLIDPASAWGMGGMGVSMATLIGLASIDDVTDRDTHGSAISYLVYLVAIQQLDRTRVFPQPDENRTVAALPLKTGESPFYIEAHDIPTLVSSTEKGDITTTGTNTFVIVAGGDRDNVKTFIENYSGGKFIIIYKHVKDPQWHILGELERPMLLSNTETKDDKDGRYSTLTFSRPSVDLPLLYGGDPTGIAST